jgi:hypothetical protein
MFRLALKVALAAAALWAVWTFVPVRGRTLAERWKAAPTTTAFVERSWDEASHALGGKSGSRPQARQKPAPAPRPTEGHTEADRKAVDRILSERLER